MHKLMLALLIIFSGVYLYQDLCPNATRCKDRGGRYYLIDGCILKP